VSYIAANAFVDALAHLRRETERCGLSINWGAISGVGIQTRAPELAQRLADRGMQSLTQFELTEVLVRLLSGAHRQVGVVKLDLRSWAASFPNLLDSPYWAELLDSRDRERGDSASGLGRLRGLLASPAEERQQLLEQFLKEQLGEVLRLKLPLIDPQLPFVQFGFDSLMAVELRNRLDAELRVIVPIGYLLKDVNLTQLTTYVFERLPDSAAGVEQEEIEEGDV
jgi:acyl carrier protein